MIARTHSPMLFLLGELLLGEQLEGNASRFSRDRVEERTSEGGLSEDDDLRSKDVDREREAWGNGPEKDIWRSLSRSESRLEGGPIDAKSVSSTTLLFSLPTVAQVSDLAYSTPGRFVTVCKPRNDTLPGSGPKLPDCGGGECSGGLWWSVVIVNLSAPAVNCNSDSLSSPSSLIPPPLLCSHLSLSILLCFSMYLPTFPPLLFLPTSGDADRLLDLSDLDLLLSTSPEDLERDGLLLKEAFRGGERGVDNGRSIYGGTSSGESPG